MAVSFHSVPGFNSTAKYQNVSKGSVGASIPAATTQFTSFFGAFGQRRNVSEKRWGLCLSVADSNQLTTDTGVIDKSGSQTSDAPNGSLDTSNPKQEASLSPDVQPKSKRSPLTARERLRVAKVLSRYTDSKPLKKSARGKNVLDALRDSERGKKRSGLPEAPTNIFDDSKRGMPKQGLTWDFPGGNDLFLILFSFVFISTVMFATTFVVWKLGAIHFNEN
ncbi:uncharacterized protein LOC126630424 isoform X2 [Malus sylvestris]|uniref:uncharacterized protein LOC126630424 isoform X2 n=1 Tax=Malus sylvestris TaxID=3752 RepID=UPI0021AC4DED|nr:uncharacterized protein LOC126630424 isoform X2 [Malus sylvestris]